MLQRLVLPSGLFWTSEEKWSKKVPRFSKAVACNTDACHNVAGPLVVSEKSATVESG